MTEAQLVEHYNEYNRRYFDSKLQCKVRFNKRATTRQLGCFKPSTNEIVINPILNGTVKLYNTLLHEMCHAEVTRLYGTSAQPHGREWQTIALRVGNAANEKITTCDRSKETWDIIKAYKAKKAEEAAKPTCYSKRKLQPVERKIWTMITSMYKGCNLPRGAKSRCLDELFRNPKYPRVDPMLVQKVMNEIILPRFK